MPAHLVVGHAVAIVAPITALLAMVYACVPEARSRTRAALVVACLLTAALCVWAGEVGGDLLERLTAAAPARLPPEVAEHTKGSDALVVSVFLLLTVVLASVWRTLRPGRPTGAHVRAWQAALVVTALAVLVTTSTVLLAAVRAVWSTQTCWVP